MPFRLSSSVIGLIRKKFKNESLSSIVHKAKKAAKVTHPLGNRRYEDYIFRIDGDVITSIKKIYDKNNKKGKVKLKPLGNRECTVCFGEGTFTVWETCSSCHGVGCQACGSKGEILMRRRCQCVQKKHLVLK